MSERFYAPNIDAESHRYTLEGPEAHHLIHVCRARVGTEIELFDGRGTRVAATVIRVEKRYAELALGARGQSEPKRALTVASALPKGDRASMLVEKCAELGVTTLIPLVTARSVTLPREGKREKFDRYAIEACKQCGRDDLMVIDPPTAWTDVVARSGSRWLLDRSGDDFQVADGERPDMIAIGPEGGWTNAEIESARARSWRIVRLPGHVLRIETAAISAVSLVQMIR